MAYAADDEARAGQQEDPLRIIVFGAHPDDCEIEAAGVARMWANQGHEVKFVSVTNGDIGHFSMAGGVLADRRREEVEKCADILGIETQVLNIHDGELMPTLENRKKIVRLIREWEADVVMHHRPNDYHPDHRAVGMLVRDAAYMVIVPHFVPNVPPLDENPVFLYTHDNFTKPVPFEPDVVVGIDQVAQYKWDCMYALESQFLEWQPWLRGELDEVPEDEAGRRAYVEKRFKARAASIANEYRDKLIELYGEERGSQIQYAEAFEVTEYGSQPSKEELMRLFPFFGSE